MSERLAYGDRGEWVEYLQKVLQSKGVDPGAVDGVFGGVLDAKVRGYQADHGLTADGVVDTVTWASLTGDTPTASDAAVTLDWAQLPLLSSLAQYPADEDGVRQFLRDYGVDIDLLTTEA